MFHLNKDIRISSFKGKPNPSLFCPTWKQLNLQQLIVFYKTTINPHTTDISSQISEHAQSIVSPTESEVRGMNGMVNATLNFTSCYRKCYSGEQHHRAKIISACRSKDWYRQSERGRGRVQYLCDQCRLSTHSLMDLCVCFEGCLWRRLASVWIILCQDKDK